MVCGRPALAPGISHSHFNVQGEVPQRQLLAWRDRVGHIIDVLPSLAQLENPFSASIDCYAIGELAFTDCRTDPLLLERSVARISTDSIRDYVFHVFIEGGTESVAGFYPQRRSAPSVASIVALDMNQPVRMQRNACRVLTFFLPRALVDAAFPDAETLHGRVIENTTPLMRLLIEHVASLNQNMASISASEAGRALRVGAQLLVAAFGKQARLSGTTRAAVRAAMFGQVRRYIQANLHQAELSPESLLIALQLPRATLYRLFEHEGGLGAYIRNCRLREAADELVRFPDLAVMNIAYGLGFKSASDFTRAFRRAYAMAPQDLRAHVFELRRVRGK
ncbi:MAG: helix-turn-helix domain-containing protein [Glaciimonas sp.]|nr:helix-turn-helix domain-containing protein [Glaciimonas sp.]